VPLPAAATPVTAASAHASKAGWAAIFARVHSRATPALLQKWLQVGPSEAQALMSELVAKNIVHAPVAGSAAAVRPMYPGGGLDSVFDQTKTVTKTAKKAFDALVEEDEVREEAVEPDLDEVTDETA